jgi:CRISPR-associated protein Csa1
METLINSDGRLRDAVSERIITSHRLGVIRSNITKMWNYESELLKTHVSFLVSRDPQINVETLVSKAVPILTEQQVDGTRLYLSERLTLDAITTLPNRRIVIDLKTGEAEEFHKLTTTGYALAWESLEKEPVDIGCIMYLRFSSSRSTPEIKCNFHSITDELRSWFIEARNEKIQMIATQQDPGVPDSCPSNCPFFYVCETERGR